jgi:inner membrane protein
VDALSHALIAYILFSHPSLAPLVPFAILGAVIPDTDIFFSPIADRNASLYLFTHGGLAHSITGAFLLSLLACGTAVLVAAAGVIPKDIFMSAGAYGFAAVLAGALLHVAIDTLACPGIPLLAPFSDRKYTLGVLPGPSILLASAALGLVAVTVPGLLPLTPALMLYGGVVVAYLAVRTGMFLIADTKLPGRKIPLINPLRWLVIREDETTYRVGTYTLFRGSSGEAVFEKFRDTDGSELARAARSAEVRRFLFHAYCVTAERIGNVLILADPVREKGYLYYPPKYKRVAVPSGNDT